MHVNQKEVIIEQQVVAIQQQQQQQNQQLAIENSTQMSNGSSVSGDPFDINAEPIMYMSDNRTPAITDIGLVVVSIIFLTCLLLLFVLLPSIRKNKWRNLVCLSLMIIIGASIPLSMIKNTWLIGELELESVPYDSHSYKNQFSGLIKVEIGLNSMNVTLIGKVTTSGGSSSNNNNNEELNETVGKQQQQVVHYNERFHFIQPDQMQLEHQDALQRGLPYPILSVTDFFSHDSDGFNWTRQIRQAGYYTGFLLYVTFAFWLVTMLLMCVVPAYFMTMLRATCLLSAASYLNYLISASILSPTTIIIIHSHKLVIAPNNQMLIISTICSILAYYCAQYIDVMFQLQQSIDQSMTIMDSEEYLNDKKVLNTNSNNNGSKKFSRSDSIIIPIGDIEKKFAEIPKSN